MIDSSCGLLQAGSHVTDKRREEPQSTQISRDSTGVGIHIPARERQGGAWFLPHFAFLLEKDKVKLLVFHLDHVLLVMSLEGVGIYLHIHPDYI